MGKRVTSSGLKKERKQESVVQALLEEMYAILVTIYLFIILVIMPLYIQDHYYEMAFHKWKIYLFASLGLLGVVLLAGTIYGVAAIDNIRRKNKSHSDNRYFAFTKEKAGISVTEILVVLYGVSVVITLFSCGYPRAAWLGTDSWYMGALAQLLFVGVFLVFSRLKAQVKDVIWMIMIASSICFVIGIAQRCGWDFLHLYYGMIDEVKRDYLSTIGNRTWYSGYISVVFPLGVYLFWQGEKKKTTWLMAVYTFIAFSAIVTNNSDSIYAAVAAVMFALFVMSVGDLKKIYRWLCILALWFGACCTMSIFTICFPDDTYTRQLRGFTGIFLDIRVAVVGMIVTGCLLFVLWFFLEKKQWKRECAPNMRRRLQIGGIVIVAVGILLLIGIIVVNTTGLLQKWFGITISSNYFLFDDLWGDSRGFNWKMTLQMFRELSPFQKLFGIGSDCYAFYAYSDPVYAEELYRFFGENTMVANAHNEWLNALLCHGIIGSLLYLGVFITAMKQCLKQSDSEHAHPFIPAVGLCVLGYITHNVFCYQQICATGPIFVLMGIAMQKIRSGGNGQNER